MVGSLTSGWQMVPRGVVVKDATILESADEEQQQARLAKLAKFGIPPEHRMLVVSGEEFVDVRGFGA